MRKEETLCFWMLRKDYIFLTVTSKLLYQVNSSLHLWSEPFFLPKLKANGNIVSAKYSHFKRQVLGALMWATPHLSFYTTEFIAYLGFLIAFKSMPPFSKASGRFTPHLQLFGSSVNIEPKTFKVLCGKKKKTHLFYI